MPEPQRTTAEELKRRKVRKGTHSCWECVWLLLPLAHATRRPLVGKLTARQAAGGRFGANMARGTTSTAFHARQGGASVAARSFWTSPGRSPSRIGEWPNA